jgi:hypothetical protein
MQTPRPRKVIIASALVLAVFVAACDSSGSTGGSPRRSVIPGRHLPKPLPPSKGKTYYVSTKGADSNPGTLRRPWRTVQSAVTRLKPGQRALVRAGTYRENVLVTSRGRPRAPITIANYPGERPVLRPAGGHEDNYPLEIFSASYFRVQGFLIEAASGPSADDVYFEGATHHVELSGNEIRNAGDQGVFSERTTHDLKIIGNTIHNNGPSPLHQSHGIYVEGQNQLIANNLVYDNHYGFGIHVYPSADHVLVVDNTVVGNGISGILVGAEGSTTVNKTLLVNNIVAYNHDSGMQSYFPEGATRGRGNIAYGNLGYGNPDGGFANEGGGIDYSFGNIAGDPRFRDRAGHDYRLGSGSNALDRAVAGYSLRRDFAGRRRPRGRGYDIGAFER